MQKVTPFNTGKILIGSAYVRDMRPELTASEEVIQAALLAKKERRSIYFSAALIASASLCAAAFVSVFYIAATVFKTLLN